MMTQEEFMDVQALHAAGWTIRQIADHVGYHPATVSGWVKAGGPPPTRRVAVETRRSISGGVIESPGCSSTTPSCRPAQSCE